MQSGRGKKQILFVAEGDKAEHDLILAAMEAFGIDTTQFAILLFRTNIHILLNAIVGANKEFEYDFESIDMKELLADLLESGKGTVGRFDYHGVVEHTAGDADWLRTALITDVFLLFDFDPHASEYSPDVLHRFQRFAVDSTDCLGKLLLSYPMIEAYKDACTLDSDEFFALDARQPIGSYKSSVHARLVEKRLFMYREPASYCREDFARGIARSVVKARCLAAGEDAGACYEDMISGSLAESCDTVDLVKLLELQQKQFEADQSVAVVFTALFFLTIWPLELDLAWAHCKSLGRT